MFKLLLINKYDVCRHLHAYQSFSKIPRKKEKKE